MVIYYECICERNGGEMRIYVKKILNIGFIVHRSTHQLIESHDNTEELKRRVLELLSMTNEEFYTEMFNKGLRFKTRIDYYDNIDKEKEEWYENAWKRITENLLNEFEVPEELRVEEELPLELIKNIQNGKIKEKNEVREVKKLKRVKKSLPDKVNNKKLPEREEVEEERKEYKNKDELRKAYRGGEIDLVYYKESMKKMRG